MNEQMEGKVAREYLEFEDTNITAYLHYRGFRFAPHSLSTNRIVFRVYGEGVENAVADMYGNPEVKVMDYIKCLKAVRSSMFTMKGMNQDKEG
jgi:hypothetical protein